ncbi:MAG: hypothetical protein QOH25_2626 [Acidobacteriota bacterium]|jgi:hypothetical protein|nr:hypothetical protein [Acidobacteriota bacterium]
MKRSGLILTFLLMFATGLNTQHGHPSAREEKPVVLLTGLGEMSHPSVTIL